MRYPLLLRRVLDNMGPDHSSRVTVQDALRTVEAISREVDANREARLRQQRTLVVHQLLGGTVEVLRPGRHLLGDYKQLFLSYMGSDSTGEAQHTKLKAVRLLLFSDVLLLAAPKSGMEDSDSAGSHTLCENIPLEHVKLKRYDETDGSVGSGTTFQLYRPAVSKAGVTTADRLTVWCETPDQCSAVFEAVHDATEAWRSTAADLVARRSRGGTRDWKKRAEMHRKELAERFGPAHGEEEG